VTKLTVGDPIADTFAILSRNNNCILLMADGVNWGVRSKRASRCAVRAALNYLNKYLFFDNNNNNNKMTSSIRTTHDLFKIMSKSFDEAQEFIIKNEGSMTTLCCSVVVKLNDDHDYVVCTLSIGDSTAYVFSREKGGIFELTKGSRNVQNDRDIRDVGGALGFVYGSKPDLSNINYSIMYIKSNDIVFLVSDGISDNFDPCISGCARKKKNSSLNNREDGELLPVMDPYERYLCSLNHMFEVLMRNRTLNETISAQEVR
jgi:serine/threonine protein phosphatase PrpC